MILFAVEAYRYMAQALAKITEVRLGHFQAARFENGELRVELQTSGRSEDCFILASIAPPDEQMLSVLLLAHTLKKEGARCVIAILPYLAYSRHDKGKPAESLATEWLGAIMRLGNRPGDHCRHAQRAWEEALSNSGDLTLSSGRICGKSESIRLEASHDCRSR
jgi:phosphoribosylpyrophosphate synthetase